MPCGYQHPKRKDMSGGTTNVETAATTRRSKRQLVGPDAEDDKWACNGDAKRDVVPYKHTAKRCLTWPVRKK